MWRLAPAPMYVSPSLLDQLKSAVLILISADVPSHPRRLHDYASHALVSGVYIASGAGGSYVRRFIVALS